MPGERNASAQQRCMHIAIYGASRGVGRATVDAALAAGHTVTAFARSKGTLASSQATVVTGDVLDTDAVAAALADADAVIVALGVTPSQKSNTPQDICSRGTRTIIDAMKAASKQRLVVVTSYGVGDTRTRTPFLFRIIAKTILKQIMADKEVQERDVRTSGLQWTIVQPMGLTDGPATTTPYVAPDGSRQTDRVSRADVAIVCVDAATREKYIDESIAVSASK